jgi:hypothetical protein
VRSPNFFLHYIKVYGPTLYTKIHAMLQMENMGKFVPPFKINVNYSFICIQRFNTISAWYKSYSSNCSQGKKIQKLTLNLERSI